MALAVVILLTALAGGSSPARAAELCVQLKWYHQAQFAGFYLAAQRGYYKKEGLDVRFIAGGPHIDWQERMADASCPMGVTNVSEIVVARSKGTPVKAVAAIDQVSPIVWFSLKDSGIHSPRQFKGRSVALVPTGRIHLKGMLSRVGLTEADIRLVPFSMDMSPLYNGDVDIWSGYHTNLVTKAEEEGHPVNVIHPINYGVQIYDDVVYARDELIARDPDAVAGFVKASLRGWQDAIMDPDAAVEATLAFNPNADREHELKMFMRTIPYIHTGEVPIGWMTLPLWEDICKLTCELGQTHRCPDAETVFTDRFLRLAYPSRKAQ